jgi:hypothetical protein
MIVRFQPPSNQVDASIDNEQQNGVLSKVGSNKNHKGLDTHFCSKDVETHMSEISLQKRAEAAQGSLIKLLKNQQAKGVDLGDLTAQVIIAIDYSRSMRSRYDSGEVQAVVERSLSLSLSGLDDDGVIQTVFFSRGAYPIETITTSNYQGFVDNWRQGREMGGTNYTPAMKGIVQFAQRKDMMKPGKPPIFVLFVTDDKPGDRSTVTSTLTNYAKYPIFWQFLGLGYSPTFLRRLDSMPGRVVDNVGLTEIQDALRMSDSEFYDKIISEFFGKWLPAARAAGITQ